MQSTLQPMILLQGLHNEIKQQPQQVAAILLLIIVLHLVVVHTHPEQVTVTGHLDIPQHVSYTSVCVCVCACM